MHYDIKKLSDLPVVVGTWYEGFKFIEQGPEYARKVNEVLNAQEIPVFYVMDLSQMQTVSMEGVIESAASGARSPTSNLRHRMNRGNIMVSEKSLVKLAAKGMNSVIFGNIDIHIFNTLEEALKFVKDQVE